VIVIDNKVGAEIVSAAGAEVTPLMLAVMFVEP
jgi:hypothetical protein